MNKTEALNIVERSTVHRHTIHAPFTVVDIDDFLPEARLKALCNSFPPTEDSVWETSKIGEVESKRRTTWTSIYDIPQGIREVVQFMNSSTFLRFASDVLNIPKLLPDPYFTGGGLNESFRGDYLDVHVDGNYHDASGLHRRANAILYLTPEWEQSWGGNFGIYTDGGKTLHTEITPKMNKLVLFDTSDVSYHGYPDPINCPSHVSRRSLILYYYTKDPHPSSKVRVEDPHSALWVKRGLKDKNFNTTREYS